MKYVETKESSALMGTCTCGWICSPVALEITHPQDGPRYMRITFPCPSCNRSLGAELVAATDPRAADPPKTPPSAAPPSAADVQYADLAKHLREAPE